MINGDKVLIDRFAIEEGFFKPDGTSSGSGFSVLDNGANGQFLRDPERVAWFAERKTAETFVFHLQTDVRAAVVFGAGDRERAQGLVNALEGDLKMLIPDYRDVGSKNRRTNIFQALKDLKDILR